jgi:hypothetical protein
MRVCQFRHDRKIELFTPASSNTYLKAVRLPMAGRPMLNTMVSVLSLPRPQLAGRLAVPLEVRCS